MPTKTLHKKFFVCYIAVSVLQEASSNLEHDGDMAVSMCGVSGSGWLALHEAAARNDSEVLDFLLQHAGTT